MMDAAQFLDVLLGAKEVPASAEETALIADLRGACADRDRAQQRVDLLLSQIRDLQRSRRRQLDDDR